VRGGTSAAPMSFPQPLCTDHRSASRFPCERARWRPRSRRDRGFATSARSRYARPYGARTGLHGALSTAELARSSLLAAGGTFKGGALLLRRPVGNFNREDDMRTLNIAVCAAALTLLLGESALGQTKCLTTVNELKANNMKARWQETTESDGKPLTISIRDGADGLVYSARKAGMLWLNGDVSVCLSGGAAGITLKNNKATSNVPMIARMALPSTQSAQVVNNQIRLAGGGWDGTFIGE
jgi:hypothetical protein